MQTKLTLRIDDKLIDRAKTYAKKNGTSVSQVVARYFSVLDENPISEKHELTPLVKSLKGSLKGTKVGREDYRKYLEEKYL